MKILALCMLVFLSVANAEDGYPDGDKLEEYSEQKSSSSYTLRPESSIVISVIGQGVAPSFTISPAQAYALAKRAATADAYRLIAEKVNGVVVEGKDTVRNMVMQRSTVNTQVRAMIKNATVVETTFKDGLCEVEMEIRLHYAQFNYN